MTASLSSDSVQADREEPRFGAVVSSIFDADGVVVGFNVMFDNSRVFVTYDVSTPKPPR